MNKFPILISITSLLILTVMVSYSPGSEAEEGFIAQREKMVSEIKAMVRETRMYIGKDELGDEVMQAMGKVQRHAFIPPNLHAYAYENRPLPIGADQTISQPYIVALMTDLAAINKDSVVLEVGTGSGYQAAVLAEIAKHVYTIEIIEELGERASKVLNQLGYANITIRIGDGYHGWLEHAPFDAILVTAAAEQVPEPLIQQLKPGGKLIIPVGRQFRSQSLKVIEKDFSGEIHSRDVLPVGFVPLTRDN